MRGPANIGCPQVTPLMRQFRTECQALDRTNASEIPEGAPRQQKGIASREKRHLLTART